MRIKHFTGYGSVQAKRIKDENHTLHVRVQGNHEWGIKRTDEIDVFNWLVRRFDKRFCDCFEWLKTRPLMKVEYQPNDPVSNEEVCDYIFDYPN